MSHIPKSAIKRYGDKLAKRLANTKRITLTVRLSFDSHVDNQQSDNIKQALADNQAEFEAMLDRVMAKRQARKFDNQQPAEDTFTQSIQQRMLSATKKAILDNHTFEPTQQQIFEALLALYPLPPNSEEWHKLIAPVLYAIDEPYQNQLSKATISKNKAEFEAMLDNIVAKRSAKQSS